MGLFSIFKKTEETPAQPQQQAESQQPKMPQPGRVRIDSREYPLVALDRKHILVDSLDRDFVDGQRLVFAFILPTDNGDVDAPTQGTIIQVMNNRVIARYLAPQPYYQTIMRKVAGQLPYVEDVHNV